MPWGNPPCIEAPRAVLGGLLALGLAGCAALSPEAPPSQPASVARPAFEVFAPDRRVRVQAGSAEAGLAYAARVADLRAEGLDVQTITEERNGKRYARYRLVGQLELV